MSERAPLPVSDPAVLLVTGFGSGLLRPAPGTWGSALALLVWWWALAGAPWPTQLLAAAVLFAVGTWLTDRVGRRYGVHDDARIVVDEFVGLWITLLAAPPTWLAAGLGFLLFRLFDVWKPWPIRWAERRVPGALGVMLDDVLAGIAALAVLQTTLWAMG